jgi:hypothetical protein
MSAIEDRVPPPTGWSVDQHFYKTKSELVWRPEVLEGLRRLLIPDASLDAFTPAVAARKRDAVERAKRIEALQREGLAASERQAREHAKQEAERKRVLAATAQSRQIAREHRKRAELQEFRSRLKGPPSSPEIRGSSG